MKNLADFLLLRKAVQDLGIDAELMERCGADEFAPLVLRDLTAVKRHCDRLIEALNEGKNTQ